jgi:CDP-diacylglycerol--serine O-phosphatidyltransferase
MPRLKTSAAKERLLRHVRKQRLKYISVLPSLITILNGVCGFASIIFAAKAAFAKAGYMLLLAMAADVLDGRLARMSRTTSSFGGQLDSLCDVISFGVAPAFLIVKVMENSMDFADISQAFENFSHRFIWLAAAGYISCAAIRLARFNVEHIEDESSHMSVIGLPSPAAAGVIISLVIFQQESLPELLQTEKHTQLYLFCETALIYALPFIAIGLAILMVSRIRYPHILNQYIRGKKPFAHFIRALLLAGLIIWSRQAALVFIFCGFATGGFLKWFYHKVIRRKPSFQPISELHGLARPGNLNEADIAGHNRDIQ